MSSRIQQVIAIVRHGETDWNSERRIQGQTEVPLNREGRRQAADAAVTLSEATAHFTAGSSWRTLTASPLGRAQQTAAIIAENLERDALSNNSIATDAAIIERDFGSAEGLPVTEAFETWPGLEVPDAEPLDDLANRAAAALRQYVVEAPGSILVSHGAWIRAGLARITGDDVPRVLNGEVWILHAYEDTAGRWVFETESFGRG
ncbi:MAG: histidine phosphatase family protein [Canibacter sp.]